MKKKRQPLILIFLSVSLIAPLFLMAEVWYVNYENALEAINKKHWLKAIQLLNESLKEKKQPRLNAKTTGLRYIHYLPYYHLGLAYYNMGDYKTARHYFNVSSGYAAVKDVPELYGAMRKYLEICAEKLDSDTSENSGLIRKYLAQGDDFLANNRPTEAKDQYIRAQQLIESSGEERGLLEGLKVKLRNVSRMETAARNLARADELYRNGQYNDAELLLTEVLRLDPGNMEAKRFIETVRNASAGKAKPDDVSGESPASATSKTSAPANSGASPAQKTGNSEDLKQSVRDSLLDPLIQEGRRLFADKRYREAEQKFQGVAQVQPNHAEAITWLGKTLVAMAGEDVKTAVSAYFNGRLDESGQLFSMLAEWASRQNRLSPEVRRALRALTSRFLAVILIEKYLLGLDNGANWRTEAAKYIADLEKIHPGFRLEPEFFSPKVVEMFEAIQRDGEK